MNGDKAKKDWSVKEVKLMAGRTMEILAYKRSAEQD